VVALSTAAAGVGVETDAHQLPDPGSAFVLGFEDLSYLREKSLEPMERRVITGMVERPSYAGVLSDTQIESLILYIKMLSSRAEAAGQSAGGEQGSIAPSWWTVGRGR
jgi:hypothetical protein